MNKLIIIVCTVLSLTSCANEHRPNILTIAFGSCNHQTAQEQPIWKEILEHHPDIWIWLGDIVYTDTEDMDQMKADYDQQKNNNDYQHFLSTTDIIGVWDDHDYGANNAGKEYPEKDNSKANLFSFLDIHKDNPASSRPGAYQSYTYMIDDHQIKVILLDVRYFRDEPGQDNTIIGETQWAWLEKELAESEAEMHIIGGGSQFLPVDHRFEKWADYPKDRARLIATLDKYDVDLPLLISGDRHLAEMSLVRDTDNMPILEVTSSGLTHSYRGFTAEENRYRVGGEVVSERNFGLITITSNKEGLSYNVAIYNDNNELQYELSDSALEEL